MYVPCRGGKPNPEPLTREEILHWKPFHEAVIVGALPLEFYQRLCAMALASLDRT